MINNTSADSVKPKGKSGKRKGHKYRSFSLNTQDDKQIKNAWQQVKVKDIVPLCQNKMNVWPALPPVTTVARADSGISLQMADERFVFSVVALEL